MLGAWPAVQVRRAEQSVLGTVAQGALMAKAAKAVAVTARDMLVRAYGSQVLVLVGSGDNGGDALYAGADLARSGASVQAMLAVSDRVHAAGLRDFLAAGGRVTTLTELDAVGVGARCDLIVDGLLGIGATGPLRDSLARYVELANDSGVRVLAVDLPSGVDPDTGVVASVAVRATRTVCMGVLKLGLLVGAGREHAGRISVLDIGLGPVLGCADSAPIRVLELADVAHVLRMPGAGDDKYTRGVVGIAAGSAQYPGAALLAVASAGLGGAGAVRYAGASAQLVVAASPQVLVTDDVSDAGRVQAWVVGPGIGTDERARTVLAAVLEQPVPVLVDADGLTVLAARTSELAARSAPTVLTPHDREFERLFGAVGADRISAARRAAADSGATVLLKGSATIIASPDGTTYVNPTGSSYLATAGSGDVLSGLIGSILATGVEPGLAAAAGAFLHGLAGIRAAESGPVTAAELPSALRAVLSEVLPYRRTAQEPSAADGV